MLHSESYNKMKREQNAAYDLNKALRCLQKDVREVFIMCDINSVVDISCCNMHYKLKV